LAIWGHGTTRIGARVKLKSQVQAGRISANCSKRRIPVRCGSFYNKLLYSDCLSSLKLLRSAPNVISNCNPPSRMVSDINRRRDSLARNLIIDWLTRTFPVLDLVLSINHVLRSEIPCMFSLLRAICAQETPRRDIEQVDPRVQPC